MWVYVCMGNSRGGARIINTVRVEEDSPELAGGRGSNVQSLGVESRNEEVGSRLAWRLRCPPQHKKPKKLEERGGGPTSMGIWFLWVILIWKGRGQVQRQDLVPLGLEQ